MGGCSSRKRGSKYELCGGLSTNPGACRFSRGSTYEQNLPSMPMPALNWRCRGSKYELLPPSPGLSRPVARPDAGRGSKYERQASEQTRPPTPSKAAWNEPFPGEMARAWRCNAACGGQKTNCRGSTDEQQCSPQPVAQRLNREDGGLVTNTPSVQAPLDHSSDARRLSMYESREGRVPSACGSAGGTSSLSQARKTVTRPVLDMS